MSSQELEELNEETRELIKDAMKAVALDMELIPRDVIDRVKTRFSSLDQNSDIRVDSEHLPVSFSEKIALSGNEVQGTVRVMAFNAPCLMTANKDCDAKGFNLDSFSSFLEDGSMNIFQALAIMTLSAYKIANREEKKALRNTEEAALLMNDLANDIGLLVNSDAYKPVVEAVKKFLSVSGVPLVTDNAKQVIAKYIIDSNSGLLHSKLSKVTGGVAIATAGVTVGAGIGAGAAIGVIATTSSAVGATATAGTAAVATAGTATAAVATAGTAAATAAVLALPFLIPLAVVALSATITLSVISEKHWRASESLAKSAIQLMRVANYELLFSSLKHYLTNRSDCVAGANVLLMAFDDLEDVEKAPTYRLITSRADLLRKPQYRNKGAMVKFIQVKDLPGVDRRAPIFGSYLPGGMSIFSFYKEIFIRMSQPGADLDVIERTLKGCPTPQKLLILNPLPPGWIELKDPQGKTLYMNQATMRCSYEFPDPSD